VDPIKQKLHNRTLKAPLRRQLPCCQQLQHDQLVLMLPTFAAAPYTP
jgi:hypothetical protein